MPEPSEDGWHEVTQGILREAEELYGSGDDIELTALAARVREHFLDRWYRLAPFGVTSRRDLESLTVEATVGSYEYEGETRTARMVRVSYTRTSPES